MRILVWVVVLILVILHQDYWQWNKADLVFGFLPWNLAYHAALSVLAALAWLFLLKTTWPAHVDQGLEAAGREESA